MIGIWSMVPYRKWFQRPENSMNRYPVRCSSECDECESSQTSKGASCFLKLRGVGGEEGVGLKRKIEMTRRISRSVTLCNRWVAGIHLSRERKREGGRILYMDFNETSVITYYCTYGWDGRREDLRRERLFLHLKTTSGVTSRTSL